MMVGNLTSAWNKTLTTLGLGKVHVEGNSFRHLGCDETGSPLRVVDAGERIQEYVGRELNIPFETDCGNPHPTCPFRAFVLPADDDSYYAGVIYHHWVADSASIRMVLREWFYSVYEPVRARNQPLKIANGGYWRFFGPERGRWNLGDGLLSTLRLTTRFSNVRRVEHEGEDYRVASMTQALPDGMIHQICQAARRERVTVNDLFLAASAQACDQAGFARGGSGKELALGTIVDLRPSSQEDLRDVFGLFLGFTTIILRPQTLADRKALLASVSRQSAWHKQEKLAQSSLLRMAAAVAESRFLSPRTWVKFYQRHMPLAAGMSNVNLGRTWVAEYHPSIVLDYLRFSPTGPALPVVFTPSSLGDKSHIALTYRTSLIAEDRAKELMKSFMGRLKDMVEERVAASR